MRTTMLAAALTLGFCAPAPADEPPPATINDIWGDLLETGELVIEYSETEDGIEFFSVAVEFCVPSEDVRADLDAFDLGFEYSEIIATHDGVPVFMYVYGRGGYFEAWLDHPILDGDYCLAALGQPEAP